MQCLAIYPPAMPSCLSVTDLPVLARSPRRESASGSDGEIKHCATCFAFGLERQMAPYYAAAAPTRKLWACRREACREAARAAIRGEVASCAA